MSPPTSTSNSTSSLDQTRPNQQRQRRTQQHQGVQIQASPSSPSSSSRVYNSTAGSGSGTVGAGVLGTGGFRGDVLLGGGSSAAGLGEGSYGFFGEDGEGEGEGDGDRDDVYDYRQQGRSRRTRTSSTSSTSASSSSSSPRHTQHQFDQNHNHPDPHPHASPSPHSLPHTRGGLPIPPSSSSTYDGDRAGEGDDGNSYPFPECTPTMNSPMRSSSPPGFATGSGSGVTATSAAYGQSRTPYSYTRGSKVSAFAALGAGGGDSDGLGGSNGHGHLVGGGGVESERRRPIDRYFERERETRSCSPSLLPGSSGGVGAGLGLSHHHHPNEGGVGMGSVGRKGMIAGMFMAAAAAGGGGGGSTSSSPGPYGAGSSSPAPRGRGTTSSPTLSPLSLGGGMLSSSSSQNSIFGLGGNSFATTSSNSTISHFTGATTTGSGSAAAAAAYHAYNSSTMSSSRASSRRSSIHLSPTTESTMSISQILNGGGGGSGGGGQSGPGTTNHSRRPSHVHQLSSTSSVASLSSHNPLSPTGSTNQSSLPYQRDRHSSIASLQSFFEGVGHITRVRSPILRGHSRTGSRDDLGASASGSGSGTPSLANSGVLERQDDQADPMTTSTRWRRMSGFESGAGGGEQQTMLRPMPTRPDLWGKRTGSFSSLVSSASPSMQSIPGSPPNTSPLVTSTPVPSSSRPTPPARPEFVQQFSAGNNVKWTASPSPLSVPLVDAEVERAGDGLRGRKGSLSPRSFYERSEILRQEEEESKVGEISSPASLVPASRVPSSSNSRSPTIQFNDVFQGHPEGREGGDGGDPDNSNTTEVPPSASALVRGEERERQSSSSPWWGDRASSAYYSRGRLDYDGEDHRLGGDDIKVFEEGDVVGPGTNHQGLLVKDCFEVSSLSTPGNDPEPLRLEVVRQLGYGSYAVVYLVKEVIGGSDERVDREDDGLDWEHVGDEFVGGKKKAKRYGKEFALKCLCKRDLSEDLLEVQRFEATLHQSLPAHENIVALHRALETSEWLFLVLEYCPGQDLFYWLEQARDHEDLEGSIYSAHPNALSRTSSFSRALSPISPATDMDTSTPLRSKVPGVWPPTSPERHEHSRSPENTPPSPSLLASTDHEALLSRRRLRLISRMFGQMCDAVQACHDVGISHRDIKPENFIVMDGRGSSDGDRRVVVKITDWGLGSSDVMCEDWECGSRPYMAYECRNNLRPSYDPQQADVWSLGIVLLNLLYHRCPWSDPSPEDPDFMAFREDPVAFLKDRFEGIGSSVARFLTEHVFCDVLDEEPRRVTAREFGKWAAGLVRILGEGSRRGSVASSTHPIVATGHRPSPHPEPRPLQVSTPDRRSPPNSVLPSPVPVIATPTPPQRTASHSFKGGLQLELQLGSEDSPTPFFELIVSDPSKDRHPQTDPTLYSEDSPVSHSHARLLASPFAEEDKLEILAPDGDRVASHHNDCQSVVSDGDTGTADTESNAGKAKRRKRGARKKQHRTTDASTATSGGDSSPNEADARLAEMAEISQSLAREISKTNKTPVSSVPPSPKASFTEDKTSKKQSKPNLMDRMKNAFKDGNPDLNAFAQKVKDRDAAIGYKADTYSAPAKMQHGTHLTSYGSTGLNFGVSSFGSVGTASWGSQSAGEEEGRGRTKRDTSPWASASSRRERLDQRKRPADQSVPPRRNYSGTTLNSSSPSRNTPLSSFSSLASVETPSISSAQRSGNPRFNITDADSTPRAAKVAPSGAGLDTIDERESRSGRRPQLPYGRSRDAATSTSSLVKVVEVSEPLREVDPAPQQVPGSTSTLALSSNVQPSSYRNEGQASVSSAKSARPSSRGSSVNTEAPTTGKKKLARMLESFTKFNRGVDTGSKDRD